MHASLSIAMATFNGAKFLPAQLDSLAAQDVLPRELVACDDGSSDETVEILEAFKSRAPFPIRIHRNERRLGYARNFARATSLCTGPFIAFCDQDDLWASNKIAAVCKHFSTTDHLLCIHDYAVFFDDGRPEIPSHISFLQKAGYNRVVNVKGCSLAFRRELIDRIGWPPAESSCSHDVWVCFGGLLLEKTGYIAEPLIRHRIHNSNTSAWLPAGKTDWLRRNIRRLQVPHFTSTNDLDVFISLFIQNETLESYRELIERCAPYMRHASRTKALHGLRRRQVICDFLESSDYFRPVTRITAAAGLFLRGVYANAGGMVGLLQDFRGMRSSRS